MSVNGACLCGAVRFEVDGPFDLMLHCHCSMCRKHHGTAFATFVAAPLNGFRWLSGRSEITSYASSVRGVRCFCRRCGSVVPSILEASGQVIVPAGNLQGDLGIEPQSHIFVGSKAPWYDITDALPQHREYPPEFNSPGLQRAPRASRPGVASGSCLCGAVTYEASSNPMRMFYCHCSRCRRSRSAAHAANIFYTVDGFQWTYGAEHVREYKVPEAQFFTAAFCERCGSKLPRVSRDRGTVVVSAGSLDCDPGIRVMANIFVADKAPWFRITDAVRQFEQGPI